MSQSGPRKWDPRKLNGLPKIRELILGDLPRAQSVDSWAPMAHPTPGLSMAFSPGMGFPLPQPSLLQALRISRSHQSSQPPYLERNDGLSGRICRQLWNRSVSAGFHWEVGSRGSRLFMSVSGLLRTVLYQYPSITHHPWCVSCCAKEGCSRTRDGFTHCKAPRQWPRTKIFNDGLVMPTVRPYKMDYLEIK